MELKQVDVKTAFIYGKLDENIYMELLMLTKDVIHGLMNQYGRNHNMIKSLCKACECGREEQVLKLNKSMYGLKQAAKQWYMK